MSDQAGFVDSEALAKLLNLTSRRIQQLAVEGVVPKATRGKYPMLPCVQRYVKYLQDRVAGTSAAGRGAGGVKFYEERTRREAALARIAELDLAARESELVHRAAYDREVSAVHRQFRDRLVAMCASLSPQLAAEDVPARCRLMLIDGISDALRLFDDLQDVGDLGSAARQRGG